MVLQWKVPPQTCERKALIHTDGGKAAYRKLVPRHSTIGPHSSLSHRPPKYQTLERKLSLDRRIETGVFLAAGHYTEPARSQQDGYIQRMMTALAQN